MTSATEENALALPEKIKCFQFDKAHLLCRERAQVPSKSQALDEEANSAHGATKAFMFK